MKYLLLIALILNGTTWAQSLDTSELHSPISAPGECHFESCFTQKEVMEKAGKFSFESQEGFLDLFQARQNIKVKRGQLLPSFNLRISFPVDVFDYIPNLLGFLFPSNWFRLKESKLHEKAQQHSFISLVANQKSIAQGLYLSTHQEIVSLNALENHAKFSESLMDLMAKRYEQGEVANEDLEELNAFIGQLKTDILLQKNLIQQSSLEIAYLVTEVSMSEVSGPLEITVPNLLNVPPVDVTSKLPTALKVSPELKSLTYLAEAARFSKKARGYEFLTPESGTENAFGFGYQANLRIGQTEIEKVKIQKKAFETNLKKNILRIGKEMETSIAIYQHADSIEKSLKYILKSLLSDFDASSQIDINRYISVLREHLSTQQMKNNASHTYLQATIQLNRLLLNGPEYDSIAKLIPRNSKNIDCYLRKENKLIKKAIENEELKLPEEIEFEKEDLAFCL